MRTIETVVNIETDRKLVMQLPEDVPVGIHRVVAILEEAVAPPTGDAATDWKFPVLTNAQWPVDMPLRREEMYDDDGR